MRDLSINHVPCCYHHNDIDEGCEHNEPNGDTVNTQEIVNIVARNPTQFLNELHPWIGNIKLNNEGKSSNEAKGGTNKR